jgi:hypothetical protein
MNICHGQTKSAAGGTGKPAGATWFRYHGACKSAVLAACQDGVAVDAGYPRCISVDIKRGRFGNAVKTYHRDLLHQSNVHLHTMTNM